ncbi:DUF3331 domain-containing protein [Paraburkholderia sp. BL27I4N3]|uniref:DUF3331 domain-containing protein n=1 Tax=Paraburkholderia sp. BL27I4N3 TaxID=1938805 RepID=UPI000E24F595|nr:DUF3331 domain-containing protein [Paraburkholderia sp. BL27I4N3]
MQAALEEHRTRQSTMALLSAEGELHLPVKSRHVRPMRDDGYFRKCVIRLLERTSPTSATIAWSDATSCCYGAQLWRRRIAKKAGVCCLSGQTIAKGNAVYRPRRVRPIPRNIDAMILAAVLETVSLEEGI